MSVSIQRNEIVQLDGYHEDRRVPFKPLIKQLAEDMTANGFVDVGPQITKITISDSELTQFIDEFIVFNYNSSTLLLGEGASGLTDPAAASPNQAATEFKLDGPFSLRKKLIEDSYAGLDSDNVPNWNEDFSTTLAKPEQNANPNINYEQIIGPNAELFSYLNPHPKLRGDSDLYITTVFVSQSATTNIIRLGTTRLLRVGLTLSENAGVDVEASGVTITSVDSENQITVSAPVNTTLNSTLKFVTATVTASNRIERPSDLLNGHFFKAEPKAATLKGADATGPQPGYVGLPPISKKIYFNEYNKVKRLITNQSRGVTFLPDTGSGVNTEAKLRHYKEEKDTEGRIRHHFWVSNYKDEFFFPSGTTQPTTYSGELLIGFNAAFTEGIFQTGDKYTFTFNHQPVTPAPGETFDVVVEVGTDASITGYTKAVHDELVKTNIADPKGGLYVIEIDPNRQGVILFTSRTIGHNLSASVARTERATSSLTNPAVAFIVPQTQASSTVSAEGNTPVTGATYVNGYVHEVEIRGLDGSNIDDLFTITLNGLISQTDNTATQSVTITYQAPTNLNPAQLSENIASVMRNDPYISANMVVTAGSNFITVKYGRASHAFMRKGVVGTTHGLLGSAATSFTAPQRTIGESSSAAYALNGFLVADLPSTAQFTVDLTSFYTSDTLINQSNAGVDDPLDFELATVQAGATTTVTKVRIRFPLSRDLGTFANPVNGTWSLYSGYDEDKKTSYFVSYFQNVLSGAASNQRVSGPQVSFDPTSFQTHPNVTHGTPASALTPFTEFDTFGKEIEIESFEYITDFSMGPIVMETSATDTLSGTSGDQPYRLRFDVSRGNEIRETSPYINEKLLEISQTTDASPNEFEYLNVHIATEFQLKSDGEISDVEKRDGTTLGTLREPGFLGSLRPQFNGYLETLTHLVSPFVNRQELTQSLISGFNIKAGIVGQNHYDLTNITAYTEIQGYASVFSPAAVVPEVRIPDGANSTLLIDHGVLSNNEYRFEEKYLVGTSTELVADTPFNTGKLRLQKGFYRRSGKSDPSIASQYPMQYNLTIADHGISFYIRDQASTSQSDDNAFFVAQRHVDATTGVADFTSEQQPVHCVYQSSEAPVLFSDFTPYFTERTTDRLKSLAYQGIYDLTGNYNFEFRIDELKDAELKAMELDIQGRFRRFCVREKDVLKPWDRHVFAGINERDSHAVINPLEQLSLNDAGQLVIQFPNRLGTQRFLYTGKELDLVSFCSAGAVGQDTLITSDRFSTTGTTDKRRLYKGMMSTESFGNGMRILMLVGGNGIAVTDQDTTLLTS